MIIFSHEPDWLATLLGVLACVVVVAGIVASIIGAVKQHQVDKAKRIDNQVSTKVN